MAILRCHWMTNICLVWVGHVRRQYEWLLQNWMIRRQRTMTMTMTTTDGTEVRDRNNSCRQYPARRQKQTPPGLEKLIQTSARWLAGSTEKHTKDETVNVAETEKAMILVDRTKHVPDGEFSTEQTRHGNQYDEYDIQDEHSTQNAHTWRGKHASFRADAPTDSSAEPATADGAPSGNSLRSGSAASTGGPIGIDSAEVLQPRENHTSAVRKT